VATGGGASLEFLRTVAHMRPRTNTFGAVFRVRNAAAAAIHEFFQARGFLWLHTPIITASDCEGAGSMFRVTTLDAANPPRTAEGAVDFAQDFFEGGYTAGELAKVVEFGGRHVADYRQLGRRGAEILPEREHLAPGRQQVGQGFQQLIPRLAQAEHQSALGADLRVAGLDAAEDSQEFFASAALNTLLKPTLTVYRDTDYYPGWYATLGVSHSFPVQGDITLDLGAQVSYLAADDSSPYKEADGSKYSNLHDGVLSVGLTVPVNKYITVSPKLSYTFALSDDAEDLMRTSSKDGSDDNFLYGGVAVSMAF